ncbi:unnamed protein product, partial [Rotaria sp. Silwood2]
SNIIFVKTMPFLRTFVTFSLGVYAGMYTNQNYEVPKVESPKDLYERAKTYVTLKKKSHEEKSE